MRGGLTRRCFNNKDINGPGLGGVWGPGREPVAWALGRGFCDGNEWELGYYD